MNLNKFTNNSDLYNALRIDKLSNAIVKRKLNFFKQLMDNELTRECLQASLENIDQVSDKSFIMQIIHLLNIQHLPNLEIIKELCTKKVTLLKKKNLPYITQIKVSQSIISSK